MRTNIDQLFGAVWHNDHALIKQLLAVEGAAGQVAPDGYTALMEASLRENIHIDTVKLLIDCGIPVDAADKAQQWTALHFSARDQKSEIVELLLEAGAMVDPVNKHGNTPLICAIMTRRRKPELVKTLLKFGADPNRKNRHGNSAMDVARKTGDGELIALFEGR
jgi:ankyrin repeat protein